MNKFHEFPGELPETDKLLVIILDCNPVLGYRRGGFFWKDDEDEGCFYWDILPDYEKSLIERKLIEGYRIGIIHISHWCYVPDMSGINLIPTQDCPSMLSKDQSPIPDEELTKSVKDPICLKNAKCKTSGEYEEWLKTRGF